MSIHIYHFHVSSNRFHNKLAPFRLKLVALPNEPNTFEIKRLPNQNELLSNFSMAFFQVLIHLPNK